MNKFYTFTYSGYGIENAVSPTFYNSYDVSEARKRFLAAGFNVSEIE